MTSISQSSAKEEIKRVADIVQLIGQFVQLKRAGRNFIGLCPFHAEKAPSFTVNPERQTFHCFGCKKGGDVFTFWMEYHNASFPEALRDLAERYQVTITGKGSDGANERSQSEAIFKTNDMAADYFQTALGQSEKGVEARKYLKNRSISAETASEFRIGFAPDEWDGLVDFLKRRHADLSLAVQAGLLVPKKNGGYYDRFRGRIIFPIFDLRHRIVGFGGRVLGDALPKYLNTPETAVFRKGELLYGLHASSRAIREKGRAVIVEGYMDYLALRGHGLQEAVATLGTALTPAHVRRLKGYASEVLVVFDADEAGQSAALRSLPVFSEEGLPARAVVLPEGHDPDSFVNANGLERFLELLEKACPLFDFYLEQKMQESGSEEGKIHLLKDILPILSEVGSFPMRSLYIRRLSEKLGIGEGALWSELEKISKSPSPGERRDGIKEQVSACGVDRKLGDLQLLNLVVHHPHAVRRLMACEWKILLSDRTVLEIVETVFEQYHQRGQFSNDSVMDGLKSESAREQLREVLHRPFIYSEQEVEQAVVEMEGKARRKAISASLKEFRGDINSLNELLKLKACKQRAAGEHEGSRRE